MLHASCRATGQRATGRKANRQRAEGQDGMSISWPAFLQSRFATHHIVYFSFSPPSADGHTSLLRQPCLRCPYSYHELFYVAAPYRRYMQIRLISPSLAHGASSPCSYRSKLEGGLTVAESRKLHPASGFHLRRRLTSRDSLLTTWLHGISAAPSRDPHPLYLVHWGPLPPFRNPA